MAKATFPYAWKAGNPPAAVGIRGLQPPLFDAVKATAHSLQKLMTEGTLKSTDLVQEYVWRIEQYNGYLRAVSEYAPDVMKRAEEMDKKRAEGHFLGPLHGIPVLIKDTFVTEPSMGMGTTAGLVALIGAKAPKNSEIVDKLLEAGAVILGKTTVSEISFHKGSGIPCGWSALAGQGQSPYVYGGFDRSDTIGGHSAPGGSSSGLSIAIAAGLIAGGVGSDTEASIIAPAVRAGLFGMRPSKGIVSSKDTFALAPTFDTPGPMAKDVQDLADMLTVLVDPTKTSVPSGGYGSNLNEDWKRLRIGTLDPEIWQYPEGLVKRVPKATEQMFAAYKEAYARMEKLAGVYHENVDLRPADDFTFNGASSIYSIIDYEFVGEINNYLASLITTPVRSLQELVDWNEEHFAEAITTDHPNQDQFVNALKIKLSPAELQAIHQHYREVGASVDATMNKYGIDIIVGPGDCFLTNHASANGYPIAAVPLNTYLDLNGRPVGLQAIAGKHNEELLLSFLKAYESSFPPRQPPTAYFHAEEWFPSLSQL